MSHRASFAKTVFLSLCVVLLCACAGRRAAVMQPLRAAEPKTPVVMIPGITGSKLASADGRIRWGNARSLFSPRDGGYAMALPIEVGADAIEPLQVAGPVLGLRILGLKRIDVYDSLVRTMEQHGYRTGDPENPAAEDTFFFLPYDWRRSNVDAARELAEFLERLRRARDEEVLHVHLIGHSNAALIARYFLKYGDASLEQAEAGAASRPRRIHVDKLILLGSASGGALPTLKNLNRGRSYAPGVGRRFRPETLFSFPSLYEALPVYREDLFFDQDGATLDVDLFDPESWRRYEWSVYGRKTRERLAKQDGNRFGTERTRTEFLVDMLDRARRLHRLLERDVEGFGATRYYLVRSVEHDTSDRALLVREADGWTTSFLGDPEVDRDPERIVLAAAPGDRHATRAGQEWFSPQEQAALAAPPSDDQAVHRKIVADPDALESLLRFLLD